MTQLDATRYRSLRVGSRAQHTGTPIALRPLMWSFDQERLMGQIALESEARGRAEGEAAALRKVIERLCDATATELTQQRQDQPRNASLQELERVSESLMAQRAWPKD